MSYQHFSTFERGRIEELSTLGYSNRDIAKRRKRHRSSIDRELQQRQATKQNVLNLHTTPAANNLSAKESCPIA